MHAAGPGVQQPISKVSPESRRSYRSHSSPPLDKSKLYRGSAIGVYQDIIKTEGVIGTPEQLQPVVAPAVLECTCRVATSEHESQVARFMHAHTPTQLPIDTNEAWAMAQRNPIVLQAHPA